MVMKTAEDFFQVKINNLRKISDVVSPYFQSVVQDIPIIQSLPQKLADIQAERPSERVPALLTAIHSFGLKGWVQFFVALENNHLVEIRELFLSSEELTGFFANFLLVQVSRLIDEFLVFTDASLYSSSLFSP